MHNVHLVPSLRRATVALLAALLAACGGGGGGGSTSAPPPPPTAVISGYVVEGPVAGATVKLYRVEAAGSKTLLGSAVTDTRGFFSIPNSAAANASVLLEASGGTYTSDATGESLALGVPLRAVSTSSGAAATVSLTPYSETAVRILEHAATQDWSGDAVAHANKQVADTVGATTVLDFIPVDLQHAPTAPVRDNDVGLSFYAAGFSGFAHRLDPNPATSLRTALDGLYQLLVADPYDDRVEPAYIGGMLDVIDHSAAFEPARRELAKALLLGQQSNLSISDDELNRRRPSGVSSGAATAPMPNDAFQMVGNRYPGTVFNSRGALIAYPTDHAAGYWRTLYTGSVAELYGDGDIGIGRWNGGATIDASRNGNELVGAYPSELIPNGSFHYAVARPPSNVPACGLRRMQLVAATTPTLAGDPGQQVLATGLTPDSTVSLQYATDSLAGFDIGVRARDGSVTRYRSTGGADSPWASGISLSALAQSPAILQPATLGTMLTGVPMEVQGLASGNGGTKMALKIVLSRMTVSATELAAAFVAPGGVDSNGCAAAVGDPGTAIDPPPATGFYEVLLGMESNVPGPGLGDSTFRARGELSSTPNLQVGATTPVYELAGNANASIGRIDGPFTLSGTSYNRSLPYAVAARNPTLPATGTRHFVLVASTLVVPLLDGATGAEVAGGRVQSATLDINFGEFPVGSPNPNYGTASFSVKGSIGSAPFSIGAAGTDGTMPYNTTITLWDGAFTDSMRFTGRLAAPSGADAVVEFKVMYGYRSATGTLLFRAQ